MAELTVTLEARRAWWFAPLCRVFALLLWLGAPISADWAVRVLKKGILVNARPA